MMQQHEIIRPRLDLEELYQGIPDESVNLTFQDLANVQQNSRKTIQPLPETTTIINSNNNNATKVVSSSPMVKLPSLDFTKGLEASTNHNHNHNLSHHRQDFGYGDSGFGGDSSSPWGHFGHRVDDDDYHHRRHHHNDDRFSHVSEYSAGFDGMMMSGVSVASGKGVGGSGGRRRRPGIPHSKICTVCSTYIYLFRTRCLVCGRVYCRQCLEIGMGEMTEGRKCIECLGLRFSQRYIERAGIIGCCNWRYPSTLKQTELKWAEKGPRRSGDRGYSHHNHHGMMMTSSSSRPRTPITPRSPISVASNNEPSFVMSATYSSLSPHHHLPL